MDDKEKLRAYNREYMRKRRQYKAFSEEEYERNREYMKTVYAEKQRVTCRERYQKKMGDMLYKPRHDKVCVKCGVDFKSIRSDTKRCPKCQGRKDAE